MTMKKVVHYKELINSNGLEIGWPAFVSTVDHPSPLVSNTTIVRTSNVIRKGDDGEFETENTIYRVFRPS